jgi:peptide/nickel transport system ATP-binding protein
MALVLITHDLGVVANVATRVAVMYAGEVVELARTEELLRHPRHPYTEALVACLPVPGRTVRGGRLGAIPGMVPSLGAMPSGCAFANRCRDASEACTKEPVVLRDEGYRCRFTPDERASTRGAA